MFLCRRDIIIVQMISEVNKLRKGLGFESHAVAVAMINITEQLFNQSINQEVLKSAALCQIATVALLLRVSSVLEYLVLLLFRILNRFVNFFRSLDWTVLIGRVFELIPYRYYIVDVGSVAHQTMTIADFTPH